MEWQPIETAPKDGSEIFVWGTVEDSPYARPHIGSEGLERVAWAGDGWWITSPQCDAWVPEPSHWMPLPPPPAQGTDAGTAETEGLGPKDDGPVAEGDAP